MFRSFILCMAVACVTQAQSFADRNTLNVGAGGTAATGATNFGIGSGPVLNFEYEFRVSKYFAVDGGDELWFPTALTPNPYTESILYGINILSYFSASNPPLVLSRTRKTSNMIHAGMRAILPLANNRFEVFIGAGPAGDWNAAPPLLLTGTWVFDVEAGGRVALDKNRRFWLGAKSELIGNWNRDNQQWVATTLNVGFRFGRGK